jgi:hypothetical protein
MSSVDRSTTVEPKADGPIDPSVDSPEPSEDGSLVRSGVGGPLVDSVRASDPEYDGEGRDLTSNPPAQGRGCGPGG